MKLMDHNTLTLDDIEWEVNALEEDMRVRGNALASGDDKEDKACEDGILEQLADGNIWAWCHIEVKGRFGDLEATDSLGACSYKSREDFIAANDYYPDMRNTVLAQLQVQVDNLLFRLSK